jgi:hypothetical protein
MGATVLPETTYRGSDNTYKTKYKPRLFQILAIDSMVLKSAHRPKQDDIDTPMGQAYKAWERG